MAFAVTLISSLVLLISLCNSDVNHQGVGVTQSDLVFVILSQSNTYHHQRAVILRDLLIEQGQDNGSIILLHEQWPEIPGSWTITPILKPLSTLHGSNSSFMIFCEEETRFNLINLIHMLNKYNYSQELFLGKPLYDHQASIVHHFAFHDDPTRFLYPDPAAGFILSTTLINSLANRWRLMEKKAAFSTDVKHELALFIWSDGLGPPLLDPLYLCTTNHQPSCASYYPHQMPLCGEPVPIEKIYFAVKTCSKYHQERVPVISNTWARLTTHLHYYSDISDPHVPTISLGVANTDRGHCLKTFEMLKYIVNGDVAKGMEWVVVADDDTLISVDRLCHLLSCYNSSQPIALGERYAFGAAAGYGYDYITGGGSMVFSVPTLHLIVTSDKCGCPQPDSPDDMLLGMCLKQINVPITHSHLFHQARPDDYSLDFLQHQKPVSFHKFWMVDPYEVYDKWLVDRGEEVVGRDEEVVDRDEEVVDRGEDRLGSAGSIKGKADNSNKDDDDTEREEL